MPGSNRGNNPFRRPNPTQIEEDTGQRNPIKGLGEIKGTDEEWKTVLEPKRGSGVKNLVSVKTGEKQQHPRFQ